MTRADAAVMVWQEVYQLWPGDPRPPPAALFHHRLASPHLPPVGASFHVLGDVSPNRVRVVSWHLDGSVDVELVPYQVDPGPEGAHLVQSGLRAPWLSREGDLGVMLEAAGWHQGHDVSGCCGVG